MACLSHSKTNVAAVFKTVVIEFRYIQHDIHGKTCHVNNDQAMQTNSIKRRTIEVFAALPIFRSIGQPHPIELWSALLVEITLHWC
jgi:hypothetical protein